MSATLTTPACFAQPAPADGLLRPRRGTLEERLEGTWSALAATGEATCPLCEAPMCRTPEGAGQCGACGSQLS